MHPRLYRLIETLQRIDRDFRMARQRPQPSAAELLRLQRLKLRTKRLIDRLARRPAHA